MHTKRLNLPLVSKFPWQFSVENIACVSERQYIKQILGLKVFWIDQLIKLQDRTTWTGFKINYNLIV